MTSSDRRPRRLKFPAVVLLLSFSCLSPYCENTGVPARWQRTFTPKAAGLYQVVLPFYPGEWEADPLDVPEAVPYSWHADGTVRRVAFFRWVGENEVNKTSIIEASMLQTEPIHELPPPPSITIDQGHWKWIFRTDYGTNRNAWQVWNVGPLATRRMKLRVRNEYGNRCDFGISAFETLWRGTRVRLEIRLTACKPGHPTARNWPLFGGVYLDRAEIMTQFSNAKVGDEMCAWHRYDTVRYAVCNEWKGHLCGSNGVDYTKATGGSSDDVIRSVDRHKQQPWWGANFGHPEYGPSTGMHGDFGVCRLEIADAVQKQREDVWPALHALCTEWLSSPYHLIDTEGQILRQPLDYPQSWSTVLGQPDRGRHPYPIYGKTRQAEEADTKGRVPEDNAHIRSHALSCILEFAPTALYLEEVTGFRAQALLNIYGGEERAYARTNATALEIVPFVSGELRQKLLDFISDRMRFQIALHKQAGYRSPRADGPRNSWIQGKKVFLPWQTGMMFGAFWAAHLSGHEKLRLTNDEINTVRRTMTWIVNNTWRQNPDRSWQHAYASAVDLSEHNWGGAGIAEQGLAGLEAIIDIPRAIQILVWAGKQPGVDRWFPRRL